jgi:putative transcriptional regulator
MAETYRSDLCAIIHDMAESLHRHCVIGEAVMREFDEGCLIPTPTLTPTEIREIRKR